MSTFRKDQVKDIYFLSPMQEGMLFHTLFDQEKSSYFEQMSMTIVGNFDITLLEKSMNMVIERYDVFRTTFLYEKIKRPVQVVLKERPLAVYVEDIAHLDETAKQQYVEQFTEQDRARAFDLTKDTLMRLSVLKRGEQAYELIWSHHHILMDGWCLGIVMGDFFKIYEALRENKQPQLGPVYPYSDYIKWLERQNKQEALVYWKNYLLGYEQQICVPKRADLVSGNEYVQDEVHFHFDEAITKQLYEFASRHQTTLNTVVQAIWGLLLQKYNGVEDVVFGSVVSGRPPEVTGIETMVGLFINTIPIRVQSRATETFADVLAAIQDSSTQAKNYDYVPLYEIQNNTIVKSGLIDHIMVFENYPVDEGMKDSSADANLGYDVTAISMYEQTNYDFNIMILPFNELTVKFNYNTTIHDPAFVQRMAGHMEQLTRQVLANPNLTIKEINITSEDEQNEIINVLNATEADYPRELTVHQLFEAQVAKTPDQPAVIFSGESLTYAEVNAKANQLARILREKGVKPDSFVGVMTDRSFEMVISILATLKAGGAFVPIDPDYPEERIKYMLEDSEASVLLTQTHLLGKVASQPNVLDVNDAALFQGDASNLEQVNTANDLVYIIYTSGTTGRPKGVMLEHRNLVNLFHFEFTKTHVDFSEKVLQYTTMSFDVSYQEIFSTLLAGGQLYLIDNETKRNVEKIIRIIEENQITILFLPVSFLKFIFNEKIYANSFPACIKHIITAGEQLVVTDSLRTYLRKYNVHLHNHYGPSETHVVTTYTVDPKGAIPELPYIGQAINNTSIYIVDQAMHLMPVGVAGELLIAGDNVGRGYLNNAELTEEKFLVNPFKADERMYRTGDLARLLPDGNIEYLGRIDHQVKIRGHRIELGEIESQLLNHTSITKAAVIDRKDESGNKYLCAYFVADKEIPVADLRQYLLNDLPDYMVPSYFIKLDEIPVTPNGKTDRRALPEPDGNIETGAAYIEPTSELEQRIAPIWEEILGVKPIGIQHNFFSLGGHSLKAMMLMSRINKECEVDVPIRILFEKPTIQALAQYIEGGAGESNSVIISAVEEQEHYPVSSMQKRMYVLNQFEGAGTSYNMPGVFLVEGKVERERLQQALQQVINRHETLRTSFHSVDGEPVQKVHKYVPFSITYTEASESEVTEIVANFVRTFDLAQAPLLRAGLVKLSDEKHIFLFDMHHIISDGVSMGVLVKEFVQFYHQMELPTLRIQYKDFAVWQNNLFQAGEYAKQEAFWLETFAGELPVLDLPTDFPRPSVQSFVGNRYSFTMDKEWLESVNRLAAQTGTTLYMVLLAAYNVLLSRYTRQEDIVVGSPMAGRPHADVQDLIGMFVNTLAMRNKPEGTKTFTQFLADVKQNALQAYENQDYPFEALVEKLDIQRDISRNPLFDTVFMLQNMDMSGEALEGLTFTPYEVDTKFAKFDLSFEVREDEQGLSVSIDYATKLFTEATIERMGVHFTNIVRAVTTNADTLLADIDILSEQETKTILYTFNDTATDYPRDLTLAQLFEAQVAERPEHPALVFASETITYAELNAKANQLARLLRAKGVQKDSVVGIRMDRSFELMIAVMAILKAGGAYLALDLDFPEERVKFMIEDSQTSIILTRSRINDELDFAAEMIDLDDKALYTGDDRNLAVINGPLDLAYIIYTSGSTGRPKGVMVGQRNVVRMVGPNNYCNIGANDRLLQTGALGFDATTFEFFNTLTNGATIYLVDKSLILDAEKLAAHLADNQISVMWLTAPLFNQLSQGREEMFASLTYLLVGGDTLSPKHINAVRSKCPNLTVVNGYGPTENTTFVSCFPIDRDYSENIPIGRPISNSTAYVVDKYNNLLPIGVPGELVAGGDGVARGYVNRPDLTEAVFIANPFVPGEMMYRTGDLTRWLPDGTLEYLGRIDQQVKIRGYRIELGEIEIELSKHPAIKEAVVSVIADDNGQKSLCGYFVAEADVTVAQLRAHLAKELPSYMIPSSFMPLEQMPLTANGKVDKRALPAPEAGVLTGSEYVAPRNETEAKLATIWQEILEVEQVGIYDNFFDLGGHSLKAMLILSRMTKELQVEVPLRILFETPTVHGIAEYVLQDAVSKDIGSIEPLGEQAHYAVSSAQKRMYILNQFKASGTSYNMPGVMIVEGPLTPLHFEEAFRVLTERHETLRTTFDSINGEPVQKVHKEVPFSVEYTSITEEEIDETIHQFIRPFDLKQAPLLRVSLARISDNRHLFMLDMHHIISDGMSMSLLIQEFVQIYLGQPLPDLRIQYKDFAAWQNHLFQSEAMQKKQAFWLDTFAGEIPVLTLPTDFERPEIQSFEGEHVTFTVGQEIKAGLDKLAQETASTPFMVLLAAYNILLSKYTGQEDIVVGSPIAGRPHADVEKIIGMFVNTLALRNKPAGNVTIKAFIEQVKHNALLAFENQDYPLEALIEKVGLKRDLGRNPLFDTLFMLQNINMTASETIDHLIFEPYQTEAKSVQFDLAVKAMENGGEYLFTFEYATKLFTRETIDRMIEDFQKVMQIMADNADTLLQDIELMKVETLDNVLVDVEFNF